MKQRFSTHFNTLPQDRQGLGVLRFSLPTFQCSVKSPLICHLAVSFPLIFDDSIVIDEPWQFSFWGGVFDVQLWQKKRWKIDF